VRSLATLAAYGPQRSIRAMSLSRILAWLALTVALTACGSHDDDEHERHHERRSHEPPVEPQPPARPHAPPSEPGAPVALGPRHATAASARCEAGGGRECWLLGAMYERGEGRPVDAEQAHRYYERACALPGGFGCEDLARVDPDQAATHLAVGCDAGRAPSCAALAQNVTDPDVGASRIARACTLGDVEICISVRSVLHDATPAPAGAPTEMARLPEGVIDATVRAAAERCDANMASMCAWLAMQYVEQGSLGVPVDEDHALELSRRACNEQALGGCLLLGEILVVRQADVATAGTAFNRSCAAGNAEACDAIATVLHGLPEAEDEVALARFEACVLGLAEDCATPG
jgi:hypothetical protein